MNNEVNPPTGDEMVFGSDMPTDQTDEPAVSDTNAEIYDSAPQSKTVDDQARASRLSAGNAAPSSAPDQAEQDSVVREYEERYRPTNRAAGRDNAFTTSFNVLKEKAKRTEAPLSYSTLRVTDDERLWAAVAHASIWITLLGGFLTGGLIVPLSVFVPLIIFLVFRARSDFVAFHALQAFALQLIATIGVLALIIVGSIVWALGFVIAIILILVLVGIILVPLWGIVGVMFFVAASFLPLAAGVLGGIAAVQTYNGRDYQYPYIAPWIDRQLASGYLHMV